MSTGTKHRLRYVGSLRWKWLWSGVTLAVVSVCGLTMLPMPTRPQSYRAAVATLLDRREVPFRDIIVGELRAPLPNDCFLHACTERIAFVTVVQEQRSYGRIVCHDREANCSLTLPALRIYNEGLPDVEGVQRFPRSFAEKALVARAWIWSTLRAMVSPQSSR